MMRVAQTLTAAFFATAIVPIAFAQDQNSDGTQADRAPAPSASSPRTFRPSVSVGFDYSQGDFGDANGLDTTVLSTPVSARVDVGDFRFSVSGSWVQIEGPGGVLPGGVVVDGGAADDGAVDGIPELETNSGFGDLTLGVNYNVPTEHTGKFIVQLQGRLKLPTGSSADGLSTGEVDGGATVDVAYDLGKFTPFVTAGYRLRGDPDGADLNNTFNVSVGGSYSLGGGYALLGSYDYREATTDTAEESQEVFGAVTGKLTSNLRWTLYGSVGFTDGAPDQGAGFQLTASF